MQQPTDAEILAMNQAYYQNYASSYLEKQELLEIDEVDEHAQEFLERFAARRGRGSAVVDIGCGPGNYAPVMRELGFKQYVGIDPSSTMIDIAKRNHRQEIFRVGNVLMLDSVVHAQFPAFICYFALPFLPRSCVPRALTAMRRALTDDGMGLLALHEGEREGYSAKHDEKDGDCWTVEWTIPLLQPHLTAAGFKVVDHMDEGGYLYLDLQAA